MQKPSKPPKQAALETMRRRLGQYRRYGRTARAEALAYSIRILEGKETRKERLRSTAREQL